MVQIEAPLGRVTIFPDALYGEIAIYKISVYIRIDKLTTKFFQRRSRLERGWVILALRKANPASDTYMYQPYLIWYDVVRNVLKGFQIRKDIKIELCE